MKEYGMAGCLWSWLHLTSVTITTKIPGVGRRFSSWGKPIRNSRMQYDTNFKLRLSTIYTKCQHPLLEAAMPVAGSVLGIARMLASKRMMLSRPGLLSLFLSHYASNAIPIFPNAKKKRRYIVV